MDWWLRRYRQEERCATSPENGLAACLSHNAALGDNLRKANGVQQQQYVDFGYVEPAHAEIDAWLINWGKWSMNRAGSGVSPMFRMYRSTDANQVYGRETQNPVDAVAAQAAQKAVSRLPVKHRLAISWCYIRRNNPRKAAQSLGESLQGLCGLIRDGRQMLVNRAKNPTTPQKFHYMA